MTYAIRNTASGQIEQLGFVKKADAQEIAAGLNAAVAAAAHDHISGTDPTGVEQAAPAEGGIVTHEGEVPEFEVVEHEPPKVEKAPDTLED